MIKTLTIGNVELPNRYSSVMQGTGSRASVHGND